MNSMKRQKDITLKDKLSRSAGKLEKSGEITPERMRDGPKAKPIPSCGCDGDRSKVQCCKEQYCAGTWNVRSMNQGKLEVVKQESTF